jgi:RimJ/RimL family protein N-acetyltransferase
MNRKLESIVSDGDTALIAPDNDDIDFLKSLRNDLDLQCQLLSLPRPNAHSRVAEWVRAMNGDDSTLFFTIRSLAKDCPVGFVQVREMHHVHRRGYLGVCIAPHAQGQGYGKSSIQLVEKLVTRVFNLRKLVLHVLGSNEKAISLYQNLGYTEVGVLREHFYNNGLFHDVKIFEKQLSV